MLKKRKKEKRISVDDILAQLDGSDIDLSGTDDQDVDDDDDMEYVPKPARPSSGSESDPSDTDESNPVGLPSTSSSGLAKQPNGKKTQAIKKCNCYSHSKGEDRD